MDNKWERDGLSDVSDGAITETKIAINGATEGQSVGNQTWTSHKLPTRGENNVKDMFADYQMHGIVYGTILLYCPTRQSVLFHHLTFQRIKVWLNGEPIYQRNGMGSNYRRDRMEDEDGRFYPITLKQGKNVLLIAVDVQNNGEPSHSFFGFEDGTEYTIINPGVGYAISETTIHVGDTFILDIRADNVFDLAGWQFDITFNPGVLEVS